MRVLKTLFAAALAMAALGISAASAAPQCGLSNGKAATGAPIVIGADVTASGGADMSSAPKGAKAYFDCVNANGGINGRPIAYSWADDQTRPDKAAENAKKLVEDNKAVALVGGASIVDCIATAQYFKDQNIISIMGAAVAPPCFTARNVAGLNAGPRYGLVQAVAYAAKNLKIKHIVCPQPTFPGAEWICDGIKAYADLEGIKFSTFTFDQSHSSSSATSCARPVSEPCPISERAMRTITVSSGFTTTQAVISGVVAAARAVEKGMSRPSVRPTPVAAAPTKNERRSIENCRVIVASLKRWRRRGSPRALVGTSRNDRCW